jgi:hypothetical protein
VGVYLRVCAAVLIVGVCRKCDHGRCGDGILGHGGVVEYECCADVSGLRGDRLGRHHFSSCWGACAETKRQGMRWIDTSSFRRDS